MYVRAFPTHVLRPLAFVTIGVFVWGIARMQFLSAPRILLSWPRMFLWLIFVLSVGAVLGLFMSAVHSMIAYARDQPAPALLGFNCFIGLNIAAVKLLWLVPTVF